MTTNIPHVDGVLPAYSPHVNARADPQVAHSFRLMKGERPFLVIVLTSGAESADSVPVFSQRQTVAGTVTLDLLERTHIRSVTVQVIGEMKKEYTVHRFLSMQRELFTAGTTDSATVAPSTEASGSSVKVKRKAGLIGCQLWHYSVKLPKGVSIPCDGGPKNFRLPPTFVDTINKSSIEYHLQVRVKTGFFSSGHKLNCPFRYVPLLRPPPPSLMRQIAELEGAIISGPEDDPDGWKGLPVIAMGGVLFNSRRVEVMCELFVPLPLYYTRGAAVPIHLVISSQDDQALDLLSSIHAPRVVLIQTASSIPWQGSYTMTSGNVDQPPESHTEQIASARFSLIPGAGEQSAARRALRGQVVVPDHLVPEFRILNYVLEYSIAIYPFEAAGFSPSSSPRKPILQQSIRIATAYSAPPLGPTEAPPIYSDLVGST